VPYEDSFSHFLFTLTAGHDSHRLLRRAADTLGKDALDCVLRYARERLRQGRDRNREIPGAWVPQMKLTLST